MNRMSPSRSQSVVTAVTLTGSFCRSTGSFCATTVTVGSVTDGCVLRIVALGTEDGAARGHEGCKYDCSNHVHSRP